MTQTTIPPGSPAAGHDRAVQAVQAEVRELVRRRGVDPVGDPSGLGRLVEEVLAELERHCLDVGLPPPEDPGAVRRAVRDAVAGFGPLQPLLDDPAIEEIWINAPDRVFVARGGHSELTSVILTAAGVSELVERMLLSSGRRVDVSQPFVDAALPDGSRLHVATSEVTRSGWAVNIRKFVVAATSLAELVNLGTLTVSGAQFLAAAVAAGLNIVVSGGTQAGKTTLLNCLLASVPASQRVVTVEEVFELKVPLPDVVALQTRQVGLEGTGEVDLRRLVTEALRMRPDRIVVGEVRRGEALDLLIALNAGLPGMASVHANSAREAVSKLATLPLLAGENVSYRFTVPMVASCVDLVVQVSRSASGHRRVSEIIALPGRVERDVVEVAQLFSTQHGALRRGSGEPPFAERFAAAGIDPVALWCGCDDPERR